MKSTDLALRVTRWWLLASALAVIVLLTLVSLGTAVGRFGATTVSAHGANVAVRRDTLVVLAPVSPLRLRTGDLVVTRLEGHRAEGIYRIDAVDSWNGSIYARDEANHTVALKLGRRTGRVTRRIAYLGAPFRWFFGTLQGLVLFMLSAGVLVVDLVLRRRRARAEVETELAATRRMLTLTKALVDAPVGVDTRRTRLLLALQAAVSEVPARPGRPSRLLRGKWWLELGVVTTSALALLSMTASATFTASASVANVTIDAGHMGFTLPAAGSTYRLATGATQIAPGDLIERAVDLQVDGTTSSGLISGVNLQVTATSNTAGAGGSSYLDDATSNSLRFWVQSCAVAWSTTDVAPYMYTACSSGRADVIGSYGAATALPTSPTTCPPTGASSLHAVESSTPMSGLNTSASSHNYLVIFMCLPTATPDAFQDASITLSFAFTGTQRAGISK